MSSNDVTPKPLGTEICTRTRNTQEHSGRGREHPGKEHVEQQRAQVKLDVESRSNELVVGGA